MTAFPKIKKKKIKSKPKPKRKISLYKKELWDLVAFWVKKSREKNGYVHCYTCGKPLVIGTIDCQAGHWLPKKAYGFHYFELDNLRPQCSHCNKWLGGHSEPFRRNLEKEIGKDRVEELWEKRHEIPNRTRSWYEEEIIKFKLLNKELNDNV